MGKPNYLQERLAKERAAKLKRLAEYRWKKVYGRRDAPPPVVGPSTSVRSIPTGFEGSRRRH